ncbi:HD domain-containing protein [Candidatus Uhrbacteria bacterium]|nr:HD domain-containing protein [Candidatus Uhrbacteria bacterium]
MTNDYNQKREDALNFIKKIHTGQFRANKTPVWHHLDRVSKLLEIIMSETNEGDEKEREIICLAGLGHDSLEDTEVSEEELKAYFGEQGLELILGMTNRFGDNHPEPYVKQICESNEGVRLIKLSDLQENCASVIYTIKELGAKWTDEFFLPIVTPMIGAIIKTEFQTYPQSAERLKNMVSASYALLLNEREKFEEKQIQLEAPIY